MSPFEHGEVFVLDDGGEVDLDLGNYERTMDLHLGRDNNITTGKIYSTVIDKERRGEYLGKTVQMIPHVTDEITSRIQRVAQEPTDGTGLQPHVCLIELGGTVGDIESMVFLESLRMLRYQVGPENFCLVICSLIPIMGGVQKTKPTQHTVKTLLSLGLQPDLIVCRCEEPVQDPTRAKISQQCGVPSQAVLSVHTVPNLYNIPGMLAEGGIVNLLTAVLRLDRVDKYMGPKTKALTHILSLQDWEDLARTKNSKSKEVKIAIVAKYTEKDVEGRAYTGDTYLSVIKALDHSAIFVDRTLVVVWVDSGDLEKDPEDEDFQACIKKMSEADGILVPGGFGDRGHEGKIFATNWARENKKPFLGVCLGMQMAVVGFCRSQLGLDGCTSEEFDPEKQRVHVMRYMPEVSKEYMGATMVLGARTIRLRSDSMAYKLYGGLTEIVERQRHRYEVNQPYIENMEAAGLLFVGRDLTGERMEVIELSPEHEHPFYLATQFHPEFKSRPGHPAPPFLGLLLAATGKLESGLRDCMKRGPVNHYRATGNNSFNSFNNNCIGYTQPTSQA
jgi:CTP synthase